MSFALRALQKSVVARTWVRHYATPVAGRPLRVFWGSQSGTAHGFAEEFADEARGRGLECEVVDLKSFKENQLKDSNSVFIVACYGMGEPTDNARNFYSWLGEQQKSKQEDPTLSSLNYAVFGLGSSTTHRERFCVIGKNVDAWLAARGASRMSPRVDGDDSDCIEVQFDEWQKKFLDQYQHAIDSGSTLVADFNAVAATQPNSTSTSTLPSTAACPPRPTPTATTPNTTTKPSAATPSPSPTPSSSSSPTSCPPPPRPASVQFTRAFPVSSYTPTEIFTNILSQGFAESATTLLPVLYNKELTPKSNRSTKEMSLSIHPRIAGGRTQHYHTGDHLVVYPTNQSALVDQYLSQLDLSAVDNDPDISVTIARADGGTMCVPKQASVSARQALSHYADLQFTPTPKLMRTLTELTPDGEDKQKLRHYSEGEGYKKDVVGGQRIVLDLLRECPSLKLPLARFLEFAPILRPRFYSISSSSLRHPEEIRITYRVVNYPPRFDPTQTRHGVCSTFLSAVPAASHRSPNGLLPSYVWTSKFRLPASPTAPVIGIAGGTGIAPFMAFVAEREEMRRRTPNVNFGPFELYYGVRDPTEFAYGDEILQARDSGTITNLVATFGQDAPAWAQTGFVTDGLKSRATYFWKLLEQGASVYVCGGASGLGAGVSRFFKEDVLRGAGGLSTVDAEAYFNTRLIGENRYLEDLSD